MGHIDLETFQGIHMQQVTAVNQRGALATANPPTPDKTQYSSGSFRGTYQEGDKTFGTAGPAYLSVERPGAHAVAPVCHRPLVGSKSVHHVRNGEGTEVANVGFMVRTSYNRANEPRVHIYPFVIDGAKPANLYDPRIDTIVERLVKMAREQGVSEDLRGISKAVAPREIVGETTVLDSAGRKPAQWTKPRDFSAALGKLSFSFR